MQNPTYLMLSRHGIYYFRYPLIKSQPNESDYIRLSLRTREPKKALLLAKTLEYHVSAIAEKYKGVLMKNNEAKRFVREYCQKILEERKQDIEEDRLTTKEIKVYMDVIKTEPLNQNEIKAIDMDEAKAMSQIIKSTGLDIATDSTDYEMLSKHYKYAMPAFAEEVLRYFKEQRRYDFSPQKGSYITSESTKVGRALEDITKEFIAAIQEDLVPKTTEERTSHLKVLTEILGAGIDIGSITAERSRYVRDIIKQLPRHRNKNPKTRGLSVLESIQVDGVERIDDVTLNKYLNTYSLLMKWCVNEHYVKEDYFETLKSRANKASKAKRYAFPKEHIKLMLADLDKKPDAITKQDYEYWGTLIGIYSGARLNEIAQLELDDIRKKDDIWCFDINDNGDKHLKNKSANRLIPIHNELLKRGIIEYRDKLQLEGKTRFLHELSWGKNGYGKNLSRFFNERLLKKLGLKEKQVVFHCWRHTVNTRLLEEEVPLHIIQKLMGHSPTEKMTENYGKGANLLKQLKSALDKLII